MVKYLAVGQHEIRLLQILSLPSDILVMPPNLNRPVQ